MGLLGYMHPRHVTSMIEHYFQCEVSPEQRERLHVAISGSNEKGLPALNLTPAQIEQLCAEHDEVDRMIAALEGKGTGTGAPHWGWVSTGSSSAPAATGGPDGPP